MAWHTQLATQLRQRCIQVVCSNKEAQKCLTESNGTPAMDLGHMNVVSKKYYVYVLFNDCCFGVDIRIHKYTQTMNRTKHTWTKTDVFWIGINLMLWVSIISYFDSSPDDGGYTEYKVEIQKESEDRDIWKGTIASIDTVTQVSIMFRKKKKERKRLV